APDGKSPGAQQVELARQREEATADARSRLGRATRFQFERALRASAVLSQGRERSKTTIVRALHAVRLVQRELARRARDRGGPGSCSTPWTRAAWGRATSSLPPSPTRRGRPCSSPPTRWSSTSGPR